MKRQAAARRPMPRFTKAPADLVVTFARMIEPLRGVETRKMFGYPAAFIEGHMFASLFQSSMILRMDEEGRNQLAREYGAKPFEPMPGRPMREYMAVPEELLRSGSKLGAWLERARDFAASMPPKEKPRPKTTKSAAPRRTKGRPSR